MHSFLKHQGPKIAHSILRRPLKQTVCRQILDLADGYGARTVAEGVETKADFIAVREMGFDLVQGFLFAKPMTAKKFARTMLARDYATMNPSGHRLR